MCCFVRSLQYNVLRNGFAGGRLGSAVTKVLVCQPNLPERMSQCSAAWRSRSEKEANPPCSCESAAETVFFKWNYANGFEAYILHVQST